jgi:thioredoxin 1
MSRVNTLSTHEFASEVLNASGVVVVDLYADWCAPCRALAPVMDRLAQAYAGRVKFGKVNVDTEPEIARRYQVSSIPTLLVFHNGRLVSRTAGLPDLPSFVGLLDRIGTSVAA